MDWRIDLVRQERAKRGLPAATGQRAKDLRKRFLERLELLQGDLSLRDFGNRVGLPHSTINGWYNNPKSEPTRKDLVVIADRAELPGVPRGLLSVDWLSGLSDEPRRDTRVTAEQLPEALVDYLAEQIAERVGVRGRGKLTGMANGPDLLQNLVRRGVEQWRANAVRSRDEMIAGAELMTLTDGKVNVEVLKKLLKRLVPPVPEGDIICWEPRSSFPPAKQTRGRRKRAK